MIEGKISKSSQRGITLIALVVTIIVLLILAGITLSMITGDNGIIKQAKGAKQQTEIQGYKEELELIGIKVEKVSKGLNDKEYMDKYEEEIKKDEAFKEAEVTRKDDETIEVVTKEGYEFEVTKDKVEYIGEGEGGESTGNEGNTGNTSNTENTGDTENTVGDEEVAPPDLQQSDIDPTIIPNTYTNQAVTVKITSKIDGYTLQYSKYGTNNWKYYTDKITAEHNGVIYVRLWNGKEAGGYTTVNIGIIDRLDPKEFSLNVKEVTENSITVEGSTEDAEATEEDGCSGIKVYYFSKDNGTTWEPSEGQEGTSYTFTGLTEGTDYQMKMKAVDNAENDIETTTVTQKTKEEMIKPGEAADKNENYIDGDGDKAVIPGGFEIVPGLDDVSEGLVIRDDKGNEFVWIPVAQGEYQRNTEYADTNVSQNAYADTGYLPEIIKRKYSNMTEEQAETKAVESAGGFYISRYEAGKEGELVSRKGATVWNLIPPNDCEKRAKEFAIYNNYSYVASALCSGIQWDMVMKFVAGKETTSGKFDVTKANNSRHLSYLEKTGQNENDKVCNIYDLEGNCYEYVAEKSDYLQKNRPVARGGRYDSNEPASYRDYNDGIYDSSYSFRFVLYVIM